MIGKSKLASVKGISTGGRLCFCEQIKALIGRIADRLSPNQRLVAHAPKVNRAQHTRWTLMDRNRKPASQPSHFVAIVRKYFGLVRHSSSSEPFICLISACLRGGSNLRDPTFLLSGGHSAFPIREWLCSGPGFKTRRILSCVLHERKEPILRGNSGIVCRKLKIIN
jgi:hypothetical protein